MVTSDIISIVFSSCSKHTNSTTPHAVRSGLLQIQIVSLALGARMCRELIVYYYSLALLLPALGSGKDMSPVEV